MQENTPAAESDACGRRPALAPPHESHPWVVKLAGGRNKPCGRRRGHNRTWVHDRRAAVCHDERQVPSPTLGVEAHLHGDQGSGCGVAAEWGAEGMHAEGRCGRPAVLGGSLGPMSRDGQCLEVLGGQYLEVLGGQYLEVLGGPVT